MVETKSGGPATHKWPAIVTYAMLIAVTVVGFLVIRNFGETLSAPTSPNEAKAAQVDHSSDILLHLLIALLAVIVVGRSLGKLLAFVGQPPVIGEIVGGILLGPSLLGCIAPEWSDFILPEKVAPVLGIVAQLGVVLYMFQVGLELNAGLLRKRVHATVVISHASIMVPFLLGALLSLLLYPRLSTSNVSFTSFSLFLGAAMSVTAFPVLARILSDRGMATTELGVVAIACAATNDVTAWCLLALVIGVAQASLNSALTVLLSTLAYIGTMLLLVRPLAARFAQRYDDTTLTQGAVVVALAGLLLSASATASIGIHAIFGAFFFGAMIPHASALARRLVLRLEDLVTIVLLPAFFASTGMRTRIGLVDGFEAWIMCALIVLVATLGKFGGTLVAARLTGLDWRKSASLGILMNTRGLMELVVLNIGLDLNVISPTFFAMMVIMALVTTIATTPVLQAMASRD